MSETKINKGDKFLCILDYEMFNGKIVYREGNIYNSEENNALTDEQGKVLHIMSTEKDFDKHFIKLDSELTVSKSDFAAWYFDREATNGYSKTLVAKLVNEGQVNITIEEVYCNDCEYLPIDLINGLPENVYGLDLEINLEYVKLID